MGLDDATIQEIVRRILAVARPDRIILFGSAATGTMTPDSDVDLLVLKRSAEQPYEEMAALEDALRGMGYPFGVVVLPLDRFEETKEVIGSLAYPAHRYGRVLYEAA
jgi:uncharacterized protein